MPCPRLGGWNETLASERWSEGQLCLFVLVPGEVWVCLFCNGVGRVGKRMWVVFRGISSRFPHRAQMRDTGRVGWQVRDFFLSFFTYYFHRSSPALHWKKSRAGAEAVGFSGLLGVGGLELFSLLPLRNEPQSFKFFRRLIRGKKDNNSTGCVAVARGTSANRSLHHHNSCILFLLHRSNICS